MVIYDIVASFSGSSWILSICIELKCLGISFYMFLFRLLLSMVCSVVQMFQNVCKCGAPTRSFTISVHQFLPIENSPFSFSLKYIHGCCWECIWSQTSKTWVRLLPKIWRISRLSFHVIITFGMLIVFHTFNCGWVSP